MLSAIETLNIQEKSGGILKEYTWLDTKYMIVPNVVGMSKSDATKILKDFDVLYSGTGDTVDYMSPSANTFQSVDTKITIMLN